MSTVILGLQTFDMGLITDNCGDVEKCVPHVKPIALAGWMLVSGSIVFVRKKKMLCIFNSIYLLLVDCEHFNVENLLAIE